MIKWGVSKKMKRRICCPMCYALMEQIDSRTWKCPECNYPITCDEAKNDRIEKG